MITVIIPTIGRPLEPMRASIKAQTYKDIEIIVIYDSKRQGAVWARNQGFLASKGDYLFFCDDDVILEPVALERLLQRLQDAPGDVGYAYGDFAYSGHPVHDD